MERKPPKSLPGIGKQTLGTFVDAVYAIAMTILALEIPGELNEDAQLANFAGLLLDYCLSFVVLFALWIQHRRIINHTWSDRHLHLWLHGFVLLLVCLIPRATTLVFSYGGDVVLGELQSSLLQGNWTRAEIVDVFYVSLVALADTTLLILARLSPHWRSATGQQVWRAKRTVTLAILLVLAISFLLPMENRIVLLILPLVLLAERHLGQAASR